MHQTSIHMRQAETTGRCLTQASTSKLNLLFFFLCQMPQSIRVEKELRLLFSYISSVYWEWRSGVMAIGKDRKIFHLFSPLTLEFWCGNEILIKHGIKQSHGELNVMWWLCVWFHIGAHQINSLINCYGKLVLLFIYVHKGDIQDNAKKGFVRCCI